MFIGRERELRVLEETYQKPGFQMTVIYGRRRIGKSRLITEFIKEKRASYYVASQSSFQDNVKKWSAQFIMDLFPAMEGVSFDTPESFFQFIGNSATEEKLVIALDEIPYIAETDASFLSRLQAAIDTVFTSKNIYLIICGSAISFMEKEILSEKSPLFGRRTNQIFLKPFDYMDSARFTQNYSSEEKAIVYGVTGGVAKYLTLFDDSLSLDENLINQGTNRLNEIADKANISTATLAYIIKNLMTIGVISRKTPMTEVENKKRTAYEITDGMYRFWYRFIPAARAAIEMGRGEVFYHSYVKDKLHSYMGSVFEEMCRFYTLSEGLEGTLNCLVTNVSSWWGPGHDHKPTDIDVVGVDDAGRKAVIGECKFKNEVIDKEVFETLLRRRGLIDKRYSEVQFLFFSLSGYSQWVEKNADPQEVRLISLDEMYQGSAPDRKGYHGTFTLCG